MSANSLTRALSALCLCFCLHPPNVYGDDSCCESFDHPVMLEFMYTGDACSQSYNSQPESNCQDYGGDLSNYNQVFVKICASENHENPTQVWKSTVANLGSTFFFTNQDVEADFIPEWTHVFIFDSAEEDLLLQHLTLRSSCQATIELNDQWGSIQLAGIEGQKGGYCGTGNATLLPLSFVYFGAKQRKHLVEIGWGVSGELFDGKMEVQRSEEGRYFNAIATFSASGVSGITDYQFIDLHPSTAENYYRLKIFNEDGSASYSQIESVQYKNDVGNLIFPNPMEDELRIVGLRDQNSVQVLNAMGAQQTQITISDGTSHIDMSQLPEGLYYIVVQDAAGRSVHQVVKR